MNLPYAKLTLASSILLLTACGGGGGDSGPALPTANASLSPNQLDVGGAVNLDGADSTSPNGAVRSWVWSIAEAPEHSASKPAADERITTFVPDMPGSYSICLTVIDDKATSNPDCQPLTVTNPNPTAVATPEIGAIPGQTLQLDGTGSLPPTDGNPSLLQYAWELVSAPEGSNASIDNPSLASPRFTPDLEGLYKFRLTVSHLDKISPTIDVRVIASEVNAIPEAKIKVRGGDPENWVLGQTITLDGGDSVDADGDDLQYRWLVGRNRHPDAPQGSTATLENTHQAVTSLTPQQFGDYTFELMVYDGTSINLVTTTVKVNTLPDGHVNTPPTAVLPPSWGETYEVELGSDLHPAGNYSYDAEAKYSNELGFEWKLLSHPEGFTPSDEDTIPGNERYVKITLTELGDYTIQLRAFDGELWSAPVTATYTAMTGANRPPRAIAKLAGAGAAVGVNQRVTLDGSGSTDPDDNRLNYQWRLVDRPDGSSATLNDANSVNAWFTTDVPGPYSAELTVTDSHGAEASRRERVHVLAKSSNNAPVARPGFSPAFSAEQPFVIYPQAPEVYDGEHLQASSLNASFYLTSDAYDPDGDTLTYLWSLTSYPAGHEMALPIRRFYDVSLGMCLNGYNVDPQGDYPTRDMLYQAALGFIEWTCQDISLSPLTAGNYTLQLLISDGIDISQPFRFTVPTVHRANYPTLLLEDLHASTANHYDQAKGKSEYGYRQQVFPFNDKKDFQRQYHDTIFKPNTDYVHKRYRLTAFDQDYTITGVATESQDHGGYLARFDGLTNGQVIRKGESITVDLILSTQDEIPVRPADSWHGNEMGEGVSWSFSIAEKPGWNFKAAPRIAGYRSPQ